MTINATFIGQIIVFLILLWFISKFVTPVVSQTLAERAKKIADGLAAADKGQKDLAEATSRADAIVREARERAKQIEDLAARRSNEAIEAAKQNAQAEGARIVQAARDEAATETGRAREQPARPVRGPRRVERAAEEVAVLAADEGRRAQERVPPVVGGDGVDP